MIFQLMVSDVPAKSQLWRVHLALCSNICNLSAKDGRQEMILYTDEIKPNFRVCDVYFQIPVPENTEVENDLKLHLACPSKSPQ